MSYQEKKTLVSVLTGACVLAAYGFYAFGRVHAGTADAGDMRFWATAMLIFIGVGIAASIVIQIVFHILMSVGIAVRKKMRNESVDDKEIEKSIESEMVEDEMDKLIGLKSMRIGFAVAGVGFVASLVSLLLDWPAAVMINVLYFAFGVGSILEGLAQLYFYRKGIGYGKGA